MIIDEIDNHLKLKHPLFIDYRYQSINWHWLSSIDRLIFRSSVSSIVHALTQVNSTFCAHWLASSEVISQVLFTSEQQKENKTAFVGILWNKVTLWSASYSACVVYTKTIIHRSVSESGGYLPPLWWIIVNYYNKVDRKYNAEMTT